MYYKISNNTDKLEAPLTIIPKPSFLLRKATVISFGLVSYFI